MQFDEQRPRKDACCNPGTGSELPYPRRRSSNANSLWLGAVGAKEIDLAKCRLQHVHKVELATHALPKQEARQPDFATRSDDQIGIRQVRRTEMTSDSLGRNALDTAFAGPQETSLHAWALLEYSHFPMTELAFNIRCGAKCSQEEWWSARRRAPRSRANPSRL